MRLTLYLLGPPEVQLNGEPVSGLASDKVRALLFYLAVEADRPHRRESLAGLLWPDYLERSARTNLSNALSNLRTALGDRDATPPFLHVSRETIQFNAQSDHWVDATAFDALVERGEWEGAIAIYRGQFLEGFSIADSPPFEQWALVVREHLQRQMMTALEGLAVEREERGDYARACEAARRQLELEPWHEGAHRALMRALALSGERASALAQYQACVRTLERELDVVPGAETRRLYEEIRDGKLEQEARGQEARPSDALLTPILVSAQGLPPSGPRVRPPTPRPVPASLAGERRLATVVRAVVSESAALLDDLGPEEWTEVMADVQRVLEVEVERYGGEVEEWREGGLVALFGVPEAHEDDAERAVLAALAMQETMGRYAGERGRPELQPELWLRVGVDTGEMLVTYAGDRRKVVGRVLSLARRASVAAEPGTVLVGENAYRLVRPLFKWEALKGCPAGGMVRPLARRALLGKGRGIEGLSSPLVGRDEELHALQEAVERLQAGIGGIVTLVGEAGIGKSRLVAEIRKLVLSVDEGSTNRQISKSQIAKRKTIKAISNLQLSTFNL